MMNIALLLNRLSLGLLFFLAGLNKIRPGWDAVKGFVENAVVPNFPKALPIEAARAYGYALPFVELILGLTLAVGLFTRISAGTLALVLLSIIIAMGYWSAQHNIIDKNVILLTLALLLTLSGGGRLSIDSLLFGRKKGQ